MRRTAVKPRFAVRFGSTKEEGLLVRFEGTKKTGGSVCRKRINRRFGLINFVGPLRLFEVFLGPVTLLGALISSIFATQSSSVPLEMLKKSFGVYLEPLTMAFISYEQ